jgi:outer membrane immunogenic protein
MNKFKGLSFGVVSALALAAALPAANAADVYRGDRGGSLKDTGPVDYAPPITWTGFYFGGHVGAAFSDNQDVSIVNDGDFLAGFHLGINWQTPRNFVVGVEGDVDFIDGIDYLATVRGRLGYAFGPTLAYVTGGAAFIGAQDDAGDDITDTGYVVGLGIERKVRENISIGAEALYYGFDDNNDNSGDDNFWAARARLTYHFGGNRGGDLK